MTDENLGGRAFAVALALYALVICVTALRTRPPAAKPANAPADEFSGVRAKNILRQLVGNGAPHPVGSAADAVVRDGILAQLKQLGYQPRVQESFACEEGRCADVKNILARLDGREAGPAVMLAAHYDSVPAGPGASDDGAGIVSELEIARALKASPPLRHSVIFLMDEGEEAGLLGAAAFVQDDPWAKDVRAVVNMDNRGTSGPVTMFETGNANEWVLRVYAKAVRHPNANSLSYTVYKSLPNDTDFTVFKHAGYQGLNFAFIDGVAHYHTPLDNVVNASVASIQNEGEDGLEAVRALADSDLNFGAPSEAVYADVFGWRMIWWPARWTVGFALLALVLLLFEIAMLARRRQMRIREFALALAAWPLILIIGAIFGAALQFFLRVAGATPANWVAHPAPMLFAVWALGFGAVALIAVVLGRRAGFWGMWSGTWIWWSIVALALGIFAPGLSYVFVVSALTAGICGLAIVFMRLDARSAGTIAVVVPAFVTAIVGVYSAWFLYSALGGAFLIGITVCVALIAAPLVPLAGTVSGLKRWAFPAVAFAVAAIATTAALFVPPFSQASPEGMNAEYLQDANTGKSQWLIYTHARQLPPRLRSRAPFARARRRIFPWDAIRPFAATAPALNLPTPTMTVQKVAAAQGQSSYDVLLKSPRGAPVIALAFAPANHPRSVTINGRSVPEIGSRLLAYTRGWRIYEDVDAPAEGIEVKFLLPGTKSVSALLLDQSYGLPPQGMMLRGARPKGGTPFQSGDVTVITRDVTLAPQ